MRSMTFLVNDRSTGGRIPAVAVTITENEDGSLSFELKVIGPYTGDLRGFFFDIADESRIGTLSVTPTSAGFTEFRQGNDSIKDLGNGANMQGLLGSDGGYDAGIEIGTAGSGKDDYQSFSFTLKSSAGALTLEDFSNVDFGLRLTSVGFDRWGGRDGGVKLLEHTSSAIDAIDDTDEIDEDHVPNSVGGNVFANDENLECAPLITAVNGSAWNVGHDVEGTYGTLRLKLDGSYTYTLKPAAQTLAAGQTVTEEFSYTAKSFDELTSFSTDSAFLRITVTGANDAPQIVGGTTSGQVFEDGSRSASGQLVGLDVDLGAELDWSVTGSGPMTPRADYRFLLDNLSIVRDGLPFFNDDFGDGLVPGFPTYGLFGTFTESAGRLIMDGGRGAASSLPGQVTVIAHLATYLSDTGPDTSQGLRRGQDFTVEARYDLVMPQDLRSNYVVRLSDPGSGDDIVELGVRRMEDGTVAVALREVDMALTVPVIREAIALEPAPGDNQIVLRLHHEVDSNFVTASFDLLNGGVVTRTETLAFQASIFSNEDWTRVQVLGQAIATPQNGVYGTLSVEADGEWHYALNNAAANVQALAQGEHVTDVFTVTVTDEHGASDTEIVTIDVTGSNDAPIITGGTNFGFVAEDTPTQTASGQLFASDVDHNAQLRWSAGPATIVPGVPFSQFFGYSSDYHFTVDEFTIERNGAVIFSDPFSDGIAPPSAPAFANGTPASYQAGGGYTESGGLLHLDGAAGVPIRGAANPNLLAGHVALLLTNIDPADLTRGLKSDDSFTVEARFDLAAPGAGQAYGIGLTDSTFGGLPPDQLGDSNISLLVRPGAGGQLMVQFNDFDNVADSATVLESVSFTPEPGEDQIVVRLVHDVDEPGLVHAEFDLLGGAGGPRTFELTQAGHIFGSGTPGYPGDDENWTRAQIAAFGPDLYGESTTFHGTYGSLTVDQNGNWTYTLDNESPLVQALPGPLPPQPGQPPQILPQDVISVRVVDEHGLSSFRPVFINVAGTNDTPTVAAPISVVASEDDAPFTVNLLQGAFDVDLGAVLHVELPPVFLPQGITLVGNELAVDTTDPAFQNLPLGASSIFNLDYFVADELGARVGQSVSITIEGRDEPDTGPNTPPVAVPDGNAGDPVVEAGFAPGAPPSDAFASGNVLANDFDPDPNPGLHVTALNGMLLFGGMAFATGTYGGLQLMADGGWSYTLHDFDDDTNALAQGALAFEHFTYTVTDAQGASASTTLTVAINGTNDAPVAVDDFVPEAISEDQHALISVLANDFDVEHDPILMAMHNSFSVLGARITLGPAGTLDYDPTTSATLQNLNPGQFLIDTFTYVITDTKAQSLPATVTVTVFGVEDGASTPPDITHGDTTGQVYEDGAASVARGQLTAVDPDSAVLTWTLDLTLPGSAPQSGFVNIDDAGRWTYFLNNSAVQHLGQGEGIQDDFVVRVTDEHGAFDTQVVTINVTGTGDRPNFTTPPPALTVSEDGGFVSGSTSASDVDNGTLLHWSLDRGSALGYFSDYEFRADSFDIQKNGAPLFHDGFDGSGPPPSAPDFIPAPPPGGSSATSYSTTGMFQETGGKLVMRGSDAFAFRGTANDALVVGNEAILSTNVDPANLQSGLKQNHQFVVEGVFDLIEPQHARQSYGLTLTDGVGRVADDLLSLTVFRNPVSDEVLVRFVNGSAVLDAGAVVDSDALNTDGADQIRLRLSHEAGSGDVSASYELLDDGIVIGSGDLGQAGIFGTDTPGFPGDDENWIRAGLFSNGEDPGELVQTLAGAFGTLTVDNSEVNNIAQLVYTPGPAAQALRLGDSVVDTFFVRAVDPQGMSNSQRVDVTVFGANDAPVAVADGNSVVEDVVTTAVGNVLTNDFDVDHGSVLTVATPGLFTGAYGMLTLNADGSYVYQLDHGLADFLAEGQVVHDVFEGVYGITDGAIANFATLLDIEITGTGETAVPADGEVFEDGSRQDSGMITPQGIDLGTTLAWSVAGSGPMTPRADYRYLLDNLNIVRDGALFFNDDFGAGGPPPAAPAFNYFTFGTFLEAGGRLIMDGGLGAPSALPGGPTVIAQLATLNTDIGPDASQGLKRAQDFKVEARYDLVMPAEERSNYAVRLSDGANDIVEVGVRRMEDGSVAVALREVDVAATIPVVLEAIALEPAAGDQQIVLRLEHVADTDIITASFDLLNGGMVTQTRSFTATADIFSNEVWTRAQIIGQAIATPQNGVYGTLSVEADGEWHYALNNAAANVQALAQGEHVTDVFTVTVTDEHGASDTETVTIDVAGSNDAPVGVGIGFASFFQGIVQGVNISGTYVIEDGAQQVTRGHAFATDVDHGALVNWSVNRNPYTADYHFTLDQFTVKRGADTIFDDTFGDGNAPPSAPNFANGAPAIYGVQGLYTESGGRVNLDGAQAGGLRGIGNDSLLAGHLAVMLTNNDPADLTRGLKSDDNFTVEARFDLAVPAPGQAYGIGLTDNAGGGLPPDQLGDSSLTFLVRQDPGGDLYVQFNELDAVADTSTGIATMAFTPEAGENQIVLRLIHDAANPGLVHAEFDLLGGAGGPREFDLVQSGHIFGTGTPLYPGDDENWTRAQFLAFGEDTGGAVVEGTYGRLSIDQNGDFTYELDNDAANVQALAQGQVAVDSFNVRATDQHGVTNRVQLNVNVIGTGEAPPPVAADVLGDGQNNVLVGSELGERYYGDAGADLLIGLGGSDVFDYNSLAEGTDTIADFTPGDGGDMLDLRGLLQGYVPGVSNQADFFQLQQFQTANGPNTTVAVNADGVGFDYVPLATLQGVAGLVLSDFVADNLLL